jgi:plastocyanin
MSRRRSALVAVPLALVIVLAGCGGGGDGGGGDQGFQEPKGPAAETIKIAAGNFFFDPDTIDASKGIVELELDQQDGLHTLVFDDGKEPGFQLEVGPDERSDAKKVELKSGSYVFYCDIPGHRAQGMEGTITVK